MIKKSALFLIFISIIALVSCTPARSPEEIKAEQTFLHFVTLLNDNKWSEVWNMLSTKSQKAFSEEAYNRMKETIDALPPEIRKKEIKALGKHYNDFLNMSSQDFFVYVMEKTQKSQEFALVPLSVVVDSVDVKDNRAEIRLKDTFEKAVLVKEKNDWKIEFEE